ncbi:MAG: hypothetical protein M3460_22325 [Actinomycetota bacterium]|jgi:hypothetical protein|nr:hypothetical protein [Actinomycetota bacterium]
MNTARRCVEGWLQIGCEEAAAIRYANDTQKALQEAARAITRLIETVRVESTALVTGPDAYHLTVVIIALLVAVLAIYLFTIRCAAQPHRRQPR